MRRDPLWRVLALAAPVRGRLLLAGAAAATTVACAVALAGTAAWLLATAAGQPPVLVLAVAVVSVRALGLGRGLSRYVERLTGHDAALRVLSGTRADVWKALVPLVPGGLPRGDLLERLVGDVDALQDLYLRALAPTALAATVGTAAVSVCAWLLPSAGLVLAVGLAATAVVVPLAALLLDRRRAGIRGPARSVLSERTVELLHGAADLEACGAGPAAVQRVLDADAALASLERSQAAGAGAADALQVAASGLLVVAVLAVGAGAVAAGTIDGVALAVLVLVAWACGEVTAGLPDAVRALLSGRAAAVRLLEVLDAPAPVGDPTFPLPVPDGPLGLRVRGLGVTWPDGTTALADVDLDLPAGRRMAVVGPSGAGKSTLVDVLLRLREPSCGQVLLGDADVRRHHQDDVRRAVSGCLQQPYIFATTLHDNLLLARPEATAEQVHRAAADAGLAAWVAGLPRGWETPTGEAGAMVSGGQAQRLGLARALLQAPRVLLLDEPTAGLEQALADRVLADVLRATKGTDGASLLLVTHRLAGLEALDEVVVLSAGRVVQRGPADRLRAEPGLFRELWLAERAADELLATTGPPALVGVASAP